MNLNFEDVHKMYLESDDYKPMILLDLLNDDLEELNQRIQDTVELQGLIIAHENRKEDW